MRKLLTSRWTIGIVVFLIGIGIGGASAETENSNDNSELVSELRERLSDTRLLLAKRTQRLSDTQADVRKVEREQPETEPTSEPTSSDEAGDYSVGQYEIGDVQVSEDALGDFAMRARVTNTGDDIQGLILSASAFSGGSVVATFQGSAQNFGAGQTITMELISTDEFTSWDEIEFQIDTEY